MASESNGPLCACGCGARTKGGKWIPGHDSRARAKKMGSPPPGEVSKPKTNIPPSKPSSTPAVRAFRTLDAKKITAGNLFILHTLQGLLLGVFGEREFDAIDGQKHKYKEEKLGKDEITALAEDLTPYELNVPWMARGIQWLTDQDRHRRLVTDISLILAPRLYNHGLLPEEFMNGIAATAVSMEEGGASVDSGGYGVGQDPSQFASPVGTPIHDHLAEQERQDTIPTGSSKGDSNGSSDGLPETQPHRTRAKV